MNLFDKYFNSDELIRFHLNFSEFAKTCENLIDFLILFVTKKFIHNSLNIAILNNFIVSL